MSDAHTAIVAVVEDRHVAIGTGVTIDEMDSLLPNVLPGARGGAEVHDDVVLAPALRQYSRTFERKAGDLLLFAVFPDAEVLFREVLGELTFLIHGDCVDEDEAGFGTDHGIGGGLLRMESGNDSWHEERSGSGGEKGHQCSARHRIQGISTILLWADMVWPSESRTTIRTT